MRRDQNAVEYLSPLADGTAPLKKRLAQDTPNLAAAFAASTPGGFGVKTDYAGNEVLVLAREFTRVPWALAYKIDTAEALADSEDRINTLVMVFAMIIVLVLIGAAALWYYGSSRRASEAADNFEKLAQRFEGQRDFMHLVTDSQPNAIAIYDSDGHYRWFNKVVVAHSGLERRDLFDKHVTAVLGPVEGKKIAGWVKECLARGEPMSITHDMPSARRISDRVTMLYQGRDIWTGPTDMLDRSGNDYVHQFINGLPEGPIQLQILKP